MLFKIPFLLANAHSASKPLISPLKEEPIKESERKMAPFAPYIVVAERLFYTCLCLAECGVIMAKQQQGSKEDSISLQFTIAFFIGFIFTHSGDTLVKSAYQELGRFSTPKFNIHKEHKLVKSGPYAYIRHPIHTGYIMGFVGFLLCSFTQGSLIREYHGLWSPLVLVAIGVMVALRMVRALYVFERAVLEDECLKKQFGREWEVWAEEVRYRILIGIF